MDANAFAEACGKALLVIVGIALSVGIVIGGAIVGLVWLFS